jgi:hypothetical protein
MRRMPAALSGGDRTLVIQDVSVTDASVLAGFQETGLLRAGLEPGTGKVLKAPRAACVPPLQSRRSKI